jgi:hypothetical protein
MNKSAPLLLAPLLFAFALPALAQTPPAANAPAPAATSHAAHDHAAPPASAAKAKQVHGCELMTEAEHAQHRQNMQALPDEKARQAYRAQHHALMQQRAKERGAELVPGPSPQCKGMQQGMQHGKHMQHAAPPAATPPAE